MVKCVACDKDLPVSDFNLSRHGKPLSKCRECMKAYQKEHYKKNKSSYAEKQTKRRHDLRDFIKQAKDKPCADCKESFPYFVMDFDHLSDKSFSIAEAANIGYSRKRIQEEIDKCEVVCANCHRIRTHAPLV